MTTTNFSLCIFCLCLLTSCSKGEKKTNEPVRVKVAEAEMLVPSAEREFSFIAKPFTDGSVVATNLRGQALYNKLEELLGAEKK